MERSALVARPDPALDPKDESDHGFVMKRVLFVCLGNICRSPAAEGVARALARERGLSLFLDSAGTGGWHEGDSPDVRMIRAAGRRGYDLSHQRARQVQFADFYEFDYLVAMDLRNQSDLLAMAPPNRECDIRLLLDFADTEERETPDPYYGGPDGFDHVLDLLEAGVTGFLDHLEDDD
ncbi:MAG: low molecular weight protein-tyrosine-phosphatase [Pseudomonadota bacterium]